ncbi:TonB-dependent receptor plug domain-containing protein [Hymenobacter wooponensis]|nr:TonB-dependent receptor plug domain-containing protein [Hymenobacter wooponensis]
MLFRLPFIVGLLLLFAQTTCAQLPTSSQAIRDPRPDSTQKVIRIICASSLPVGNEPLHIVDGIPVSREQFAALNPNGIKKIDVLKGAQATAIYGSRAANGVLIITMKRRFRLKK